MKKRNIKISKYVDISNVEFDDYANLAHHCQISNSMVGLRTSIGRYSKIQYAEIGKYCSVSWDVTIGTLSHPINSVTTHACTYRSQFGLCDKNIILQHEKTIIGNDVWIGAGVIILPGVSIGSGAVIGAGAVVTHDVEPYEVVAGCPAKHLKWRFSDDVIKRLLNICWWDFNDETIIENLSIFSYKNNLNEAHEKILSKLETLKNEDNNDGKC